MLGMTFATAAYPLFESSSPEQPCLLMMLTLDSGSVKVYVMFNFRVVS